MDALPASRRAGPAARRAGPHADRDRGAPAVRHAAVAVRALGPRADRGRGRRAPARRGGRDAVRVGQPRPGRPSSDAGRPRPRARPEPVPVVRGRHPLLPRARRSPSWSSGSRSRRCSGARRGSSSSRRRAGSRPSSCAASSRSASGSERRSGVRYVALGDSYTIGTSVAAAERWPDQLVAALGPPDAPRLELVANLGVNGYTSADLIRDELPALEGLRPGVRQRPDRRQRRRAAACCLPTYAANVERILDALLDRLPADRIVTVAIPDYTVTPAGADYGDPRRRHDAIVAANATMARLAASAGIAFVDIFDLSRARRAGSVARRGRRPPPERRPVRPVARADRPRRARAARPLIRDGGRRGVLSRARDAPPGARGAARRRSRNGGRSRGRRCRSPQRPGVPASGWRGPAARGRS